MAGSICKRNSSTCVGHDNARHLPSSRRPRPAHKIPEPCQTSTYCLSTGPHRHLSRTCLWLSCCSLAVRLPGLAKKVSNKSVSPKQKTGTKLAPVWTAMRAKPLRRFKICISKQTCAMKASVSSGYHARMHKHVSHRSKHTCSLHAAAVPMAELGACDVTQSSLHAALLLQTTKKLTSLYLPCSVTRASAAPPGKSTTAAPGFLSMLTQARRSQLQTHKLAHTPQHGSSTSSTGSQITRQQQRTDLSSCGLRLQVSKVYRRLEGFRWWQAHSTQSQQDDGAGSNCQRHRLLFGGGMLQVDTVAAER